jgi:phytanoyl-CoA hydroxylase
MTDPRKASKETLDCLQEESSSELPSLWLRPDERLDETASPTSRFFHAFGFLHLRSFCSADECTAMKNEMARLVKDKWNPNDDEIDSFGTTASENTARGDYFLESSDKIHFFAEPDAMQEGKLKPEYTDRKLQALNKAGHALHMQPDSAFYEYCLSQKIRELVTRDLRWKDPVVPQSMYIFKQAQVGGAVNSHQDSTFLFTTPQQTCLGLWLALDEANLENGCLWVRPKSHKEAVRRKYKRNPQHFGQDQIDARSNATSGDISQPKFVMDDLYEHTISWDGDLPSAGGDGNVQLALLERGFIPVECKPGDLVVFCGELDHLSLPNKSSQARHTFQLHLVEGPGAGIEWSKSNWLQYPCGKEFLKLIT